MGDLVASYLNRTTKAVCAFLEQSLPPMQSDWWDACVVRNLSFQQQRILSQRQNPSLTSLDLAALLRALDQNWHALAQRYDWPPETRNYLKEMQSIRNRWAPAGSQERPAEDHYRDLDTIERFVSALSNSKALVEEIKSAKREFMAAQANSAAPAPQTNAPPESPSTEFVVGQLVFPKADPSKRGAVIAVVSGTPENRYSVFVDGKSVNF